MLIHTLFFSLLSQIAQTTNICIMSDSDNELVTIPLEERYDGAMKPSQHADAVSDLLLAQPYANKNNNNDANEFSNNYHNFLLLKLRKKIREMKLARTDPTYSPFAPGCLASTRHRLIAPLSGKKVKERDSRQRVFGNVMKESDYFPGYWLVHFYDMGRYYFVSENRLKFECSYGNHQTIGGSIECNNIELQKVQQIQEDQDMILFHILSSKIHRNPGYLKSSIAEVIKVFSKHFPWMTHNKIQRYISKCRAEIKAKEAKKKSKSSSKKDKSNVNEDRSAINNTSNLTTDINLEVPTISTPKKSSRSETKIVTPGTYLWFYTK